MNDLSTMIDHAAQQSDRWLMLFALAILIVFGVVVWRWTIADREKMSKRLTDITDRHIESQQKLVEVVTNNTHALREVKDVMHLCRNKQTNQ